MTLPFIDNSTLLKADASRVESVAVDTIPLVGQAEALPNTLYGYAWSGHGFAISLGFTKLFTDWIVSGRKPEALEPFSPARFHEPAAVLAGSLGAPRRLTKAVLRPAANAPRAEARAGRASDLQIPFGIP